MSTKLPASIVLKMCQKLQELAVPCVAGEAFELREQSLDAQVELAGIIVDNGLNDGTVTIHVIAEMVNNAYPRYCSEQRRGHGIDGMINNYRMTGTL